MNPLGGINLLVRAGGRPMSAELLATLRHAEVDQGDQAPCGFRLVFDAERGAAPGFSTQTESVFKPFTRITVGVVIDGATTYLIDGYVTHQGFSQDSESGDATFVVSGQDASILMDQVQVSAEWPIMGESAIAFVVLSKYVPLGVKLDISDSLGGVVPMLAGCWEQNDSDRNFLHDMAGAHAYRFYVTPGTSPGRCTAYWGPPNQSGTLQRALTVDSGSWTNVDNVSFEFDALAPMAVHGYVASPIAPDELPVPIVTFESMRHKLSASPAFESQFPLHVRHNLFQHSQVNQDDPNVMARSFSAMQAALQAQAATDGSTDRVVTATGTLDGERYRGVLQACAPVGVRGAGGSFDGAYYVQRVTHKLSPGSYKQDFTLSREGLGATQRRLSI